MTITIIFEVCADLSMFKSKIPDSERGKAKISATGLPEVDRGLKFEPDVPPMTGEKSAV